jgi:tRNA A37 methylthiotransferase MiaB
MKPEIKGNIAKERHRELTALIKEKNLEFRKEHAHNLEVLIEQEYNGAYSGYDQYFNKIEVSSNEDLTGNWITVNHATIKGNKNVAIYQ